MTNTPDFDQSNRFQITLPCLHSFSFAGNFDESFQENKTFPVQRTKRQKRSKAYLLHWHSPDRAHSFKHRHYPTHLSRLNDLRIFELWPRYLSTERDYRLPLIRRPSKTSPPEPVHPNRVPNLPPRRNNIPFQPVDFKTPTTPSPTQPPLETEASWPSTERTRFPHNRPNGIPIFPSNPINPNSRENVHVSIAPPVILAGPSPQPPFFEINKQSTRPPLASSAHPTFPPVINQPDSPSPSLIFPTEFPRSFKPNTFAIRYPSSNPIIEPTSHQYEPGEPPSIFGPEPKPNPPAEFLPGFGRLPSPNVINKLPPPVYGPTVSPSLPINSGRPPIYRPGNINYYTNRYPIRPDGMPLTGRTNRPVFFPSNRPEQYPDQNGGPTQGPEQPIRPVSYPKPQPPKTEPPYFFPTQPRPIANPPARSHEPPRTANTKLISFAEETGVMMTETDDYDEEINPDAEKTKGEKMFSRDYSVSSLSPESRKRTEPDKDQKSLFDIINDWPAHARLFFYLYLIGQVFLLIGGCWFGYVKCTRRQAYRKAHKKRRMKISSPKRRKKIDHMYN